MSVVNVLLHAHRRGEGGEGMAVSKWLRCVLQIRMSLV